MTAKGPSRACAHCGAELTGREASRKKFCDKACYLASDSRGRPSRVRPPLRAPEERFWENVDRGGGDECWRWTGLTAPYGYGRFYLPTPERPKGMVLAHRFSYELANGAIPDDLGIDHLCRNTSCVNPRHMEPVTNRENALRMLKATGVLDRTHCGNGHEWTPENTYRRPDGTRTCRACRRDRKREARSVRRAA